MSRSRRAARVLIVTLLAATGLFTPGSASQASPDGRDTPGVMRGDRWYLSNSFGGNGDHIFAYGLPGDTPLAGDWNGDGIDTPGVFRGAYWYLSDSYGGNGDHNFVYGNPSDKPVVGDWNCDGIDTPGVFRDGWWYLSNTWGDPTAIAFPYGNPGDHPVVGDWNGDCVDTVGIFRGDQWHLTDNFGGSVTYAFAYGIAGDRTVVGDWNGDGRDTPGVVRGDRWYLSDWFGGTGDYIFAYGLDGDRVVAGDWDNVPPPPPPSEYEEPGPGDPQPPGDTEWGDEIWPGGGDRVLQSSQGIPGAVNRYAPQVRFFPGAYDSQDRWYYPPEEYYPASARTGFIRVSELRWAHDGGCRDYRAARAGQVNSWALGNGGYWHRMVGSWPSCPHFGPNYFSDQLTRPREANKAAGLEFSEGFFLDPPNTDSVRRGVSTGLATNPVPTYFEYGGLAGGGYYATYWFFYPYNQGDYGFNHEGDWEHVAIKFSASHTPQTIAYYAHGCAPLFRQWSNVPKASNTHPIVYAARGAHGSYPSAGTWTNCESSNLPPDRTGNGTRWNTWLKLANIRRQPWLRYGGGWGEVGADSPGVPPGVTTGPSGPFWKTPTPWCPCAPVN